MNQLSFAALCLLSFMWAPACSTPATGGPPDLAGRIPLQHRPVATACAMTRAPGLPQSIAGQCKADSDCVDGTQGKNGRCVNTRVGPTCSYDTCFDDSTCLGKVCLCRPAGETSAVDDGNHCLTAGNCRSDGDCGAGGACSPSDSTCGSYFGVVSYYCHTPQDDCLDDSDCQGHDGGVGGPGFCMFSPEGSKWICAYTVCVG